MLRMHANVFFLSLINFGIKEAGGFITFFTILQTILNWGMYERTFILLIVFGRFWSSKLAKSLYLPTIVKALSIATAGIFLGTNVPPKYFLRQVKRISHFISTSTYFANKSSSTTRLRFWLKNLTPVYAINTLVLPNVDSSSCSENFEDSFFVEWHDWECCRFILSHEVLQMMRAKEVLNKTAWPFKLKQEKNPCAIFHSYKPGVVSQYAIRTLALHSTTVCLPVMTSSLDDNEE